MGMSRQYTISAAISREGPPNRSQFKPAILLVLVEATIDPDFVVVVNFTGVGVMVVAYKESLPPSNTVNGGRRGKRKAKG